MPVKKTPEPSPNGHVDQEGPWRYNEETGVKERNARALPLENKLKEVLIGAGTVISFQDEFVGVAIQKQAPDLAYGWAKLASEDARVKRVLGMILEGSAWSEALIPTLTLAVAILWHYGILVPDKLGAPMTLAVGVIPVSREVENKMKSEAAAVRRQEAAAAAQAEKDKPINGDDAPAT